MYWKQKSWLPDNIIMDSRYDAVRTDKWTTTNNPNRLRFWNLMGACQTNQQFEVQQYSFEKKRWYLVGLFESMDVAREAVRSCFSHRELIRIIDVMTQSGIGLFHRTTIPIPPGQK